MELFKKNEGATALPNRLLGKELRNLQSAATIKAILYIYMRTSEISSVSLNELLSDRAFISLFNDAQQAKKALAEAALGKYIYSLPISGDTHYFPASEEGYEDYLRAQGNRPEIHVKVEATATPNIYVLYEENVGILTPLVTQELGRIEEKYPYSWIYDAFKEAALQNKKSLKYIMRILENRDQNNPVDNNQDKYTQGEYGRHVKWK